MITRRKVISIKEETTDGTDSTPANSNANMVVFDQKFNPDIKMYDRPQMSSTLSSMAPAFGARSAQISFRAELKGSLTTYVTTLPAIVTALKACGFGLSGAVAAASALYKPASTGLKPVTIWFYEDGIVHKIVGAMGNVKISGKIGEPAIADFTFTGVYTGTSDAAIISPSALEASVPPVCLGLTATIGAYTPIISSFEFDMGNTVSLRESIGAANGYISAQITARKVVGKIDPELTTVAAKDWYGGWRSGTSAALTIGPIGTVTNNIITLAAPAIIATGVSSSDRSGTATLDVPFMCAMSSGDDEFSVLFA